MHSVVSHHMCSVVLQAGWQVGALKVCKVCKVIELCCFEYPPPLCPSTQPQLSSAVACCMFPFVSLTWLYGAPLAARHARASNTVSGRQAWLQLCQLITYTRVSW